jgi:hypothetical protein
MNSAPHIPIVSSSVRNLVAKQSLELPFSYAA